MKSKFIIAYQHIPEATLPWFIIEKMHTSDGPRDRICSGRFHTFDEAEADVKTREGNVP